MQSARSSLAEAGEELNERFKIVKTDKVWLSLG